MSQTTAMIELTPTGQGWPNPRTHLSKLLKSFLELLHGAKKWGPATKHTWSSKSVPKPFAA